MRHDEIRYTERLVRYLSKYLQIDPITPPNHEYRGLSLHLRRLYDIYEAMRRYRCASLIEEIDRSLHFCECINNSEGLFDSYIFRICMGNWLESLDRDIFLCSLHVFVYRNREVFVAISDSKQSNHREIVRKNFDKTTIFYTISHTPPQLSWQSIGFVNRRSSVQV